MTEERSKIWAALDELFMPSDLTSTHFESVLKRHPELLTEVALEIVSDLACAQPDPGGRRAVERLHAILRRARESGVKRAMLDYRIDNSQEVREHRLNAERGQLRDRRRALPIRTPDGPNPELRAKGLVFSSLTECLGHIRTTYPQGNLPVAAGDVASDSHELTHVWDAPRFLFRGESGLFPSTRTSMQRLWTDLSLAVSSVETIVTLAIALRSRLQERFDLSPRLAAGYLQHYGLPTSFLDVSPDLDVAAAFATDLNIGDWGALAVLPVEALVDSDTFVLAELRDHPMAARPRRQSAFAYLDYVHEDLKHPAAIAERGLAWHWFRFTEEDESTHLPEPTLLDARSDPFAGMIELFLNDWARFDDGAARWISKRVPAAPTVLKVSGAAENTEQVGTLVPADEAGLPFPSPTSDYNYRNWSNVFDDPEKSTEHQTLSAPLPKRTMDDLEPGAIVWALRSHVLGPPQRRPPSRP